MVKFDTGCDEVRNEELEIVIEMSKSKLTFELTVQKLTFTSNFVQSENYFEVYTPPSVNFVIYLIYSISYLV